MDVRDAVKSYGIPDDIQEHIAALSLEITDHLQQGDPAPVPQETVLQTLKIGDPTAENEMTTLSDYYLDTDQYRRALRGEVNLVVGRKGAGKTALFIQVRDRTRADKRNVVVDLKPEGYQLLKLKEDILAHLSAGAREHLVTAFWEYLLLLEVAHKLLEKDKNTYKHNHEIRDLYLDLENTYRAENFSGEGDFSERLLALSQRITQGYRAQLSTTSGDQKLTAEQVAKLLYAHDLRSLRSKISEYLERKDSVWVLFDNLDKGWSTQGVDSVDTLVLRCLIDAGRKVERDMRKSAHVVHCIVFIRNDVYEHLMKQSSDYGKEMRAVLDWTDPDLLREMLRLRLVSGLGKDARKTSFEQLWPMLCVSHFRGEDTSAYIIERSLMRPRNVLKIFAHCRGFATNLNHQKITEEDLDKGLRAYSQDLLVELVHELTDVFPEAGDLVYHFIDAPSELLRSDLEALVASAGVDVAVVQRMIDFFLYYGIIGLRGPDRDLYIFDVNYDLKMLQVRAMRSGAQTRFIVNAAFWPALGIKPVE
jgi:hypothetical protein